MFRPKKQIKPITLAVEGKSGLVARLLRRSHSGSGSTVHPAVEYKEGAASQGGSPLLIRDQPSGFCVGPRHTGTP
jgi:hypothetical protein